MTDGVLSRGLNVVSVGARESLAENEADDILRLVENMTELVRVTLSPWSRDGGVGGDLMDGERKCE